MVSANVKIYITVNGNDNPAIYHTSHANDIGSSYYPKNHPSNWRNESYWVFGTNHWAVSCIDGVELKIIDQTENLEVGQRIPLGMDGGAQVLGAHTSVNMRIEINDVEVKNITYGSELYNFSFYQISGRERAFPMYLERLSQLANNSRAVTRNSKSL